MSPPLIAGFGCSEELIRLVAELHVAPGGSAEVPAGVLHDWWQVGEARDSNGASLIDAMTR